MRKIAILLTGNLRSWELCGYIVKNCLVSKYDCDLFMVIDINNNLQHANQNSKIKTTQEEIDKAIAFYTPKNFYIGDEYDKREDSYKVIFEQYFYVTQAYSLLKEYISETKTDNYDCIMRLRFDQFIWDNQNNYYIDKIEKNRNYDFLYTDNNINIVKNLDFTLNIDIPEKDEIYVLGYGMMKNYFYINDQFWIHHREKIDFMADFYNQLPHIISQSNVSSKDPAYIEHYFAKYIQEKMIVKRSNISGTFVRKK